jgi:hypothetical protein
MLACLPFKCAIILMLDLDKFSSVYNAIQLGCLITCNPFGRLCVANLLFSIKPEIGHIYFVYFAQKRSGR